MEKMEDNKSQEIKEGDIFNWLKLAEKSFEFWDNEADEIWNKEQNSKKGVNIKDYGSEKS